MCGHLQTHTHTQRKSLSNSEQLWNCYKQVLTGTLRFTGDPQSCLLPFLCLLSCRLNSFKASRTFAWSSSAGDAQQEPCQLSTFGLAFVPLSWLNVIFQAHFEMFKLRKTTERKLNDVIEEEYSLERGQDFGPVNFLFSTRL